MGVIDILTPYDLKKKIEHRFRALQYDPINISAVHPVQYAKRFVSFLIDGVASLPPTPRNKRKNSKSKETLPDMPLTPIPTPTTAVPAAAAGP